ncbi:mCG147368 [Mus musculus]|nr:mCG147368 [Mus musculus]
MLSYTFVYILGLLWNPKAMCAGRLSWRDWSVRTSHTDSVGGWDVVGKRAGAMGIGRHLHTHNHEVPPTLEHYFGRNHGW